MLSIIIVNYKSSEDIKKCLESIVEHEPNFKQYEIIIVDNNSDDIGLEKVQKDYNFIKLISAERNGGFSYGNNIGIKHSSGDVVFLLNPDTYITDNAIEKLYAKLKDDETIHLIGPYLIFPDNRNQSYLLPKSYLTLWKVFCEKLYLYKIFSKSKLFNSYHRTYMDYGKETYVEQISGAALMFKRDVLNIIGLMDENYFMYYEESDFCLQASRKGFKMKYFPESTIVHVGGYQSEPNWERTARYSIKSFKYYFKNNFHYISYLLAIGFHLIGSFIRCLGMFAMKNKKYLFHAYELKYLVKDSNNI